MSFMMVLAIIASAPSMAQTHRHHPRKAQVTVKVDSTSASVSAYSDTTDNDNAQYGSDTIDKGGNSSTVDNDDNDFSDNPFSFFKEMVGMGVSGVFIATVCILFVLIIVLSPIILIAVILYFVNKRRNDKYRLAEKAVSSGQPIPQEMLKTERQSDDYLWRKGIKNGAIGLGLMAFFWFLGWNTMAGIGAFVFFFGAGQALIARTSANKQNKKEEEDKQEENNTEEK